MITSGHHFEQLAVIGHKCTALMTPSSQYLERLVFEESDCTGCALQKQHSFM